VNLGSFSFREVIPSSARELLEEADPLRTDDLLEEVYPVAFRVDTVRSKASVLLDCRFSDLVEGNSAILTISLLSEIRLLRNQKPAPAALTIVSSKVINAREWSIRAGLGWSGNDELVLIGASVLFVSGDIRDLDGAPPNFMTDDDATIDAGIPNWDASFTPVTFAVIES